MADGESTHAACRVGGDGHMTAFKGSLRCARPGGTNFTVIQ
jgi:hypothetical protein